MTILFKNSDYWLRISIITTIGGVLLSCFFYAEETIGWCFLLRSELVRGSWCNGGSVSDASPCIRMQADKDLNIWYLPSGYLT